MCQELQRYEMHAGFCLKRVRKLGNIKDVDVNRDRILKRLFDE
jgi:hypothetical protein